MYILGHKQMSRSRSRRIIDATELIHEHRDFNDYRKKRILLAPMPNYEGYLAAKAKLHATPIPDPEKAACYVEPLLKPDQERHLFRQYNFLKHCARRAMLWRHLDRAEQILDRAIAVRELLACANFRLSISLSRKVRTSTYGEDVASESHINLLKAIDYFDWRKGFKFSTFATWTIRKNVWRANLLMQRGAQASGGEDQFNFDKVGSRDISPVEENRQAQIAEIAKRFLGRLHDPRQREIIRLRFGIGCKGEAPTLAEVGEKFGITKERTRQIEKKALDFLAEFASQERRHYEEVA